MKQVACEPGSHFFNSLLTPRGVVDQADGIVYNWFVGKTPIADIQVKRGLVGECQQKKQRIGMIDPFPNRVTSGFSTMVKILGQSDMLPWGSLGQNGFRLQKGCGRFPQMFSTFVFQSFAVISGKW